VHQLADAFFWVNLSYYETTTFLLNKTAKASFRTPKPLFQQPLKPSAAILPSFYLVPSHFGGAPKPD
jgi:hypothetical protein